MTGLTHPEYRVNPYRGRNHVIRSSRRELEFLLFDLLDAPSLNRRARYESFSADTISAALDMTHKLAESHFAPYYQKGDQNEPQFNAGTVTVLPEVKLAWDALAASGLLAAHHDHDLGGMQMPQLVHAACMVPLFSANVSFAAYSFLTIGAANLIRTYGSDEQRNRFLPAMLDGRSAGTMALTEPDQGSALADIKTLAYPQADGTYRLVGNKMYISGGDQNITDNIIHMVLARIPGAPLGVKGISLFICPKRHVSEKGLPGAANDVALAGLLHKMGYRQTTSTVLNFGEKGACEAYLVGEAHHGLDYMFQMMNEARINVALGAAALGLNGFYASLDYARTRPQGRLPNQKNPASPQVSIIEHADVRRMLLAQKAYSEGSLTLCLYASKLIDEHKTNPDFKDAEQAGLLLDFLTPIVKTFSAEYGVRANDLGIQVLGGAGYIREYPLEQYYRDNRLNPIHEGTTGIQALDLLGRKLRQYKGASFQAYLAAIDATLDTAKNILPHMTEQLLTARQSMEVVSGQLLAQIDQNANLGLANATTYLDLAGRVTIAWMWLMQAVNSKRATGKGRTFLRARLSYLRGKIQAATYYHEYELCQVSSLAALLANADRVCLDMQDTWF